MDAEAVGEVVGGRVGNRHAHRKPAPGKAVPDLQHGVGRPQRTSAGRLLGDLIAPHQKRLVGGGLVLDDVPGGVHREAVNRVRAIRGRQLEASPSERRTSHLVCGWGTGRGSACHSAPDDWGVRRKSAAATRTGRTSPASGSRRSKRLKP